MDPMAFHKASKSIDVDSKPSVRMTREVARDDHSRYAPRPSIVFWTASGTTTSDPVYRFHPVYRFRALEAGEFAAIPEHHECTLHMALESGRYELSHVSGLGSAFPFNDLFFVPPYLDVTVPPHAVVYAGHVAARLPARRDGEFRAGPLIPLIDQAATGMSGGTWDVTVQGASAKDIAMFRATFPMLGDMPIETAILPRFDCAAGEGGSESAADSRAPKGP
jgi:hypothetical protein